MQLYLIRHAESENNAKAPEQRIEDPPITELGERQASHLADWFSTLHVETLICSPVRRALQTTRFLAASRDHHVHVWADVFEEGGIYRGHGPQATEGGPGLSRDQIIRHVVDDMERCTLDESIGVDGWWGGRDRETADETLERAAAVRSRLVKTFGDSGKPVAIVLHADFKRKLLGRLIGEVIDVRALGPMRNTGITKLTYSEDRWMLDWFNSVTHLPAELVTEVE